MMLRMVAGLTSRPRVAGQRARANGMAVTNVTVDQHPEKMPGPIVGKVREPLRPHGANLC